MSHEKFWQPLQEEPRPTSYRSAYHAQRVSALAILSVISGLISFPMMCLLFLSIPFSVFAIVCGHMSRGIVRDTHGQYSGMEMATFGLILGYCSLLIMGGCLSVFLLIGKGAAPSISIESRSAPAGQVLLDQAAGQVLGDTEETTFGVSTTDKDAKALARHYIETLHVLDATHFTESNDAADVPQRQYRAFVQLNKDSTAILLFVPDYSRFTDNALETLHERCWLIAQRTVDDVLPEDARLAVALYSRQGFQKAMTGVTRRSGPSDAGLQKANASEKSLARFFQLPTRNSQRSGDQELPDSRIENKTGPVLPAEAA